MRGRAARWTRQLFDALDRKHAQKSRRQLRIPEATGHSPSASRAACHVLSKHVLCRITAEDKQRGSSALISSLVTPEDTLTLPAEDKAEV